MITPPETLEQFTERMSKVEKTDEFVVGSAYRGNSRALFEFEGIHCTLESWGFGMKFPDHFTEVQKALYIVTRPEPDERWDVSYLICGKKRAKQIAKHYKARMMEDYYPREEDKWFFLGWPTFEQAMAFVYDLRYGLYEERWGKEPEEYESCIGYEKAAT